MHDPLVEVLRLRAAQAGYALKYAPKMRTDIRPHAMIWTSASLAGEEAVLHAALLGRLGSEPDFFFTPDPRVRTEEVKLFAEIGDYLSEYFEWCQQNDQHPQFIVSSPAVIKHVAAVAVRSSGLLARPSTGNQADPDTVSRARHLGRLLAYAFVERWQMPGQQALLTACDLLCSHFAVPMADSERANLLMDLVWMDPGLHPAQRAKALERARNLSATNRLQPKEDNEHLEPSLVAWNDARRRGDVAEMEQQEHILGNLLKGHLYRQYTAITQTVDAIEASCPQRCAHLVELRAFEDEAFGDHMRHLANHMQRLRQQAPSDREQTSRRFVVSFDRAFFAVRRFEVQEGLQEQVELLGIIHDPVARARARLTGKVLSGLVERAGDGVIVLRCPYPNVEASPDSEFYLLDVPAEPTFTVTEVRYEGDDRIFTLQAASGTTPLPTVGKQVDFIADLPQDYVKQAVDMIHKRIGRARGGEHWTHNRDAVRPLSRYRPYEPNLVQLVNRKVGL